MYFNHEKENTNIDNQFKNNKKLGFKFDLKKHKKFLIIGGSVILLILLLILIFSIFSNRSKYIIELSGEEIIEIYQGFEYTDPGYSAFDKDGNNLTDQVVVNGNVDTSAIGEYKITYTIDGVTKIRYVNVVERPDSVTTLFLYGEVTMTLKIGNKYVEPGYLASDKIDGDLTESVTVSGSVDTGKAGTYKLVYSVVNSAGITTKVERTVIVK